MDEKEKIQWHPAFQQAIREELSEYLGSLSFIEECRLTTEPLKDGQARLCHDARILKIDFEMDGNLMSANREYKDSAFTALYGDRANLLDLYNALSGNGLPSDTPLQIITLENVLFTKRRNDIAFTLGGRAVVFIEHQSTINENMPLRLLIYVARIYEKLIDSKAIYKRKLLKVLKPDFIVLYNGTEPFPDEKTLRLSDAYINPPEAAERLGGSLELEVRIVNINEGRNEDAVNKCETLSGYVRLVGKIRANEKAGMDLAAAVTKAVKDCISEGILVDFLRKHSSEVINMFTEEWDDAIEKEVLTQEAREEGREEGVDISAEIMRALIANEAAESVAVRFKVSVDKVKQIQSVMALLSA